MVCGTKIHSPPQPSMSSLRRLRYINTRIQQELCTRTIESLSEQALLATYKTTPSVKTKMNTLHEMLSVHNINGDTRQRIVADYVPHMIPAGTKGAIKGARFNKIVQERIETMCLDRCRYDVCYEQTHDIYTTSEIPDWYIYCKQTDRILIGMNQLDLWNGGAQLNRGMKYLVNNEHNTEVSKLLCVVCNEIVLKSTENKTFQLFDVGFESDTLCYLNQLDTSIRSYFMPNIS